MLLCTCQPSPCIYYIMHAAVWACNLIYLLATVRAPPLYNVGDDP